MNLDLAGKTALITGGSKGIGRSIALALAREGVDVAINARGKDDLERTRSEVAATGRKCIAIPGDMTLNEECKRVVRTAAERLGRLDILVCSANYLPDEGGTFATIPDEQWVKHMDLKFLSAVRCSREAVPHMASRKWGSVIMVSGMSTRLARIRAMDNGPTCAAMTNFGKQLATQVVGQGIRVNTILPDFTRTELLMAFFQREATARGVSLEEVVKDLGAKMPIGRLIEPEEIAHLAVFLCSNLADAITGQSIAVDGGAATSIHY
jgi:3-oxoacyl-[acyl-carrier protein] reductase